LFPYGNVQLGVAKEGEMSFDIPADAEDAGKHVSAYYFWFFPNLMLNFYPWGLSLNLVEPKGPNKTTVLFQAYVWNEQLYTDEVEAAMHQTEMEDEAVVESVQQGMSSRLYHRGRFSPKMEIGVHQFHQLLGEWMGRD
jgi:choline monooxygenase